MERLLQQLLKIKKIIADEFVGVVTSMSGCFGIDPNLGHQLFKIFFFFLVHEPYREMSHSFHILFHSSETISRLYTKHAVGRGR
jgi:hypothetical protein